MGGAPVTNQNVDYGDIQGLVRYGYGKLTEASYALLRIRSVAAARRWLLTAPVTSAQALAVPPGSALQVAFTASGLECLGVPASVRASFSAEFLSGMADDNRSRRLGDIGSNAPASWQWGAHRAPHLLVMFFALPGQLQPFVDSVTGPLWHDAFDTPHWLGTANLDEAEPFGFTDGISQPTLDWRGERDLAQAPMQYQELTALGEFLLGYRNEYGKYTERPLLDGPAASVDLLSAEDDPDKKDIGRNGTYLVMRTLSQDVRAFWRFLVAETGGLAEAQRLAELMVGRTLHGDPLVATSGANTTSTPRSKNAFTFDRDPDGIQCPIGAHVRRANPRNADFPGHQRGLKKLLTSLGLSRLTFREDLTSSVRFHRLLRRGREFGSGLSPVDALQPAPAGEAERGLHFVCLNANIARQFEFVQGAWMATTKFSGLSNENDPLIGSTSAPGCPVARDFSTRPGGTPRRIRDLPQFVTIRGGAYFFLPSVRALRYFAAAPWESGSITSHSSELLS